MASLAPGLRRRKMHPRRRVFLLLLVSLLLTCLLLAAVPAGDAACADLSLRKGSTSAAVLWLQQRLAGLGVHKGGATAYFGPNTEASVKEYQRRNGIAVSGVFGPVTAAKLCSIKWTVKVATGENLTLIAQRLGVTVNEILAANPSIRSANRIYAGQSIVVPPPKPIADLVGSAGGKASNSGQGAPAAAVPASGSGLQPQQPGGSESSDTGPPKPATLVPSSVTADDVLHGPGPRVYLTFDCMGADRDDSNLILTAVAILERAGVKAAFFLPYGDLNAFSSEIKLLGERGHYVGPQVLGTAGPPVERLLTAGLASASSQLKTLGGKSLPWVRGPGAWVMDESFATAAAAAALRVLPWHNIGGLPYDAGSVDRLDRYLIDGAVIRLQLASELSAYLEAWLTRSKANGVMFTGLDFLDGNPKGW